ncbi:chalcone isomerase family protein [Rhodoferax ferrireducens]|uniref:chalcone isomerase family protein n=1 Tax=Rhodoferax ferrireducens TaxID=192843 RepID=UPI00298DA814|nr:chalcone isomerase family protein [Rhodoferax ferrireducens]WPC66394.1 chalcone isomerase family protein [Rhodoferax ferrireducens]
MKLVQHLVLALGAALLAFNALAAPVEIHGVKLEDTTQVHGTQLQLNGAGTRYKFVVKVYVAGLYLAKKVNTPDEVINQPGPKRLIVTMLRTIDSKELGKLLTRGVEDNTGKAAISKLIPGLIRMGEIFAAQKNLVAGDQFMIDWVPGTGTVITVKDVVQGEPFQEPEFFKALMMIWLGSSPADYKLKEALLGGK